MTEKVEIFHSKVITGFDKDGEIYQRLIPFEWQSLTDEDISAVDWKPNETLHDFARDIEAILRKKNHA